MLKYIANDKSSEFHPRENKDRFEGGKRTEKKERSFKIVDAKLFSRACITGIRVLHRASVVLLRWLIY